MNLDIIEAIKYLILGIIQGVTEVLPVSSSGHVVIAQQITGIEIDQSLLFLILVNTGSLFTFVILYYRQFYQLIKDFFIYIFKKSARETTYNNFMFMVKILITCIPAGLIGLLLSDTIDNMLETFGTLFVGIGLLATGTMLYSIQHARILKGKTWINWWDVLIIGLAQGLAVLPGVSRSGMTSGTAIKRGMGIDSALNFSFLLYIPLSFASLFLMIYRISQQEAVIIDNAHLFYYVLAFIGAAIATYFAYRLIFNIFRTGKVKYFSMYCFIIGLGAIFWYIL